MNIFLSKKIDNYFIDKFGERVYGRMWSYVLLASFILTLLLTLNGSAFFTWSLFLNSVLVIGYFWLRYVFGYYFSAIQKGIIYVLLCFFVLIAPTFTYLSFGSNDYLRASYAFIECVVLEKEEIVFVSPRYQKWKAGNNKNEYYDIYIMQKQPTVNAMLDLIENTLGDIVSYEFGRTKINNTDVYLFETDTEIFVVQIEKHIDYDIIKVGEKQPKETNNKS